MQREERLRSMLELLRSEGFATVEDLSRKFYISLPTTYRDLRELERERLIIRGDGGAMPVMAEKAHLPLDFRQVMNVPAKMRIGQRAAALLEPGDVIFLDASSTAANMVQFLNPKLELTVLTNGLLTAVQLREAGIRTYCVGGRLVDFEPSRREPGGALARPLSLPPDARSPRGASQPGRPASPRA